MNRVPETEGTEELGGISLRWRVKEKRIDIAPPPPVEALPAIQVRMAPACVEAFVRDVAKIDGVKCVVIEEEEPGTVHITTFAARLTEDTRAAIYDLEAATIENNPTARFDFHLRRAEEALGTPPSRFSANHFFAVWGEVVGPEE